MCDAKHEGHECNDRPEGHKGEHHDHMKRVYWVLRADGSLKITKEGPRS